MLHPKCTPRPCAVGCWCCCCCTHFGCQNGCRPVPHLSPNWFHVLARSNFALELLQCIKFNLFLYLGDFSIARFVAVIWRKSRTQLAGVPGWIVFVCGYWWNCVVVCLCVRDTALVEMVCFSDANCLLNSFTALNGTLSVKRQLWKDLRAFYVLWKAMVCIPNVLCCITVSITLGVDDTVTYVYYYQPQSMQL